jgi:hypothetical protein
MERSYKNGDCEDIYVFRLAHDREQWWDSEHGQDVSGSTK